MVTGHPEIGAGRPTRACPRRAPRAARLPAGPPGRRAARDEAAPPAASGQRILAVELRSPDGRCWNAIGGGPTVAAAIEHARESCPDEATWDVIRWNQLYGD